MHSGYDFPLKLTEVQLRKLSWKPHILHWFCDNHLILRFCDQLTNLRKLAKNCGITKSRFSAGCTKWAHSLQCLCHMASLNFSK